LSEAALATPLRVARAPGRDWLLRAALVGPLVAWMIAFYALPVVAMLLRSVAEPHWTLDNLLRLGTDGIAIHVFLITFRTAAIVTIATAVIGYPVAFALAQMSRAWANPLLLLILLPFWTSCWCVRTRGWCCWGAAAF
jgi:ABC-type spermidine/putrescine transport system permease subunit I